MSEKIVIDACFYPSTMLRLTGAYDLDDLFVILMLRCQRLERRLHSPFCCKIVDTAQDTWLYSELLLTVCHFAGIWHFKNKTPNFVASSVLCQPIALYSGLRKRLLFGNPDVSAKAFSRSCSHSGIIKHLLFLGFFSKVAHYHHLSVGS